MSDGSVKMISAYWMDFHPELGLALNTEKLYFQPAKRLEWYSQREEWIIINKIQKYVDIISAKDLKVDITKNDSSF